MLAYSVLYDAPVKGRLRYAYVTGDACQQDCDMSFGQWAAHTGKWVV